MDPELASLLAAARLEIEDDAPRLVLADWLEEHGDVKRAEWVRLSVRASALRQWNPVRRKLLTRLEKREVAHAEEWFGLLQAANGVIRVNHAAGMVYLELMPQALNGLDELLNSPEGAWVDGLRCWDGWSGADFARLLRCRALTHLSSLMLGACRESDGIPPLAETPHLKQLSHLVLSHARITANGLRRVIEAGVVPALTRLGVGTNLLEWTGVRALAESGWMGRLTSLDLTDNQLGVQAAPLCAGPRLRDLSLARNGFGDRGVAALPFAGLASVRALDLSFNDVGADGVAALAAAELPALTDLNLEGNVIDDAGLVPLLRPPVSSQLRFLQLSHNRITDVGAQSLLRSPLVERLHRLTLFNNGLSPAMAQKLRRAFGAALLL
jgi:uncharacterized protein (TIGR02996 family)